MWEFNVPEECLLLGQTASCKSCTLRIWSPARSFLHEDVGQYGQGGVSNLSSTFNNSVTLIDLPAPTLNISAFSTIYTFYPSQDSHPQRTELENQNPLMFTSGMSADKTFEATFF